MSGSPPIEADPASAGPILEGAANFRDLGGLPTADGRRVRAGRLFRSQALAGLTDADLELIRDLGVRLVVDLRSDPERERLPNRWPAGHDVTVLPLSSTDRGGDFRKILREDPSPAGVRRAVIANYRAKPREFASILPTLFARIAGPDGLPVIIHCHAGKDRTGFAVALLLSAIGVTPEAIRDDYARTARHRPMDEGLDGYVAMINALSGQVPSREAASVLNVADPEFLDIAFAAIRQEFGSTDSYLEKTAGVTSAMRLTLRENLLEPQ